MLFNSLDFAIFLPIVFMLYWFLFNKNLKLQNLLIVVSSYVFYGWWDWRFLSLILFSTLVDYLVGVGLRNNSVKKSRKFLLTISVVVNLGFLGFFKYYNFFVESFIEAFTFFGITIQTNMLNVILPVGISFYTFQTLSYSIDVYKRKLEPTTDFVAFAAFVSFFPQLVAGPIERATNLLPQFYKKRVFEYSKAVDGIRQILWGLFKKIVIADNCAEYANTIFNNYQDYSASTLVIGAVFFAFQIYGDFSGYSDIAIGTSRLFGFNLMRNFAFPYFSRDIAEFWRRWHISLSTWFRDYLYIPLGGSRATKFIAIRNTFIIFIVSGFWHGANWTFIMWGLINALLFLPLMLTKNNRRNIDVVAKDKILPNTKEFFQIFLTFTFTTFAWIFFRATSIQHAFNYLIGMFDKSIFSIPQIRPMDIFLMIFLFIVVEWLGRDSNYAIEKMFRFNKHIQFALYFILLSLIFVFAGGEQQFIYFQF